jgi:hypothetical protein
MAGRALGDQDGERPGPGRSLSIFLVKSIVAIKSGPAKADSGHPRFGHGRARRQVRGLGRPLSLEVGVGLVHGDQAA